MSQLWPPNFRNVKLWINVCLKINEVECLDRKICCCSGALCSLLPFLLPLLAFLWFEFFFLLHFSLPSSLKCTYFLFKVLILKVLLVSLSYKRLLLMKNFILLPDNSRTTECRHLPQLPTTCMLLFSYISMFCHISFILKYFIISLMICLTHWLLMNVLFNI